MFHTRRRLIAHYLLIFVQKKRRRILQVMFLSFEWHQIPNTIMINPVRSYPYPWMRQHPIRACCLRVLWNSLHKIGLLHLIQIQGQSWVFTVPLPFLPFGKLIAIWMFTTKHHQIGSPISRPFSKRFVFRYLLSY